MRGPIDPALIGADAALAPPEGPLEGRIVGLAPPAFATIEDEGAADPPSVFVAGAFEEEPAVAGATKPGEDAPAEFVEGAVGKETLDGESPAALGA